MTDSDQKLLNLSKHGKWWDFLFVCFWKRFDIDRYLFICKDPFSDATGGVAEFEGINSTDLNLGTGLIHIRIQQRNGRKTLTTVQGISEEFDKKKLVRAFKKDFACNGTVVEHSEYGEVIQLQGDQRSNVCIFLKRIGIAKDEQLKVIYWFHITMFTLIFTLQLTLNLQLTLL